MKQWLRSIVNKLAKIEKKHEKEKRGSAFSVIVIPVAVLLVVLTVVIVMLFQAVPDTKKPTTPTTTAEPQISLLLPVGEHKPGTKGFYNIQSDFYDYFYPLLGAGHITVSAEDGHFSDSEMIQFALIRLSFEDAVNINDGVTKVQLEKMTKRYFNDVPNKLEGYYLKYDAELDKYFPQNEAFVPGVLMSLQKLTVGEDGVCIGEFYRSQMPDPEFITNGGQTEEDFKQSFLNGYFEGLDDVQHIRMIFHQYKTADGDVYNVIRYIEPLVD